MTTTEVKQEPSTPALVQNEETPGTTTKNTSARKAAAVRPEFILPERGFFYKDLLNFHDNRNTPIGRLPKINGKDIDLHKLYAEVVRRGGWLKVNLRNEWEDVMPAIDLPSKCTNGSVAIKYIYTRFLDKYEKLNFLGEDPDRVEEPEEEGRHKKWSSKTFNSVQMVYNYAQHKVSDHLRSLHRLSTDFYKSSEYDKLVLSLMSPLPNEQDFAINVCTLMANESKHTLKVDHCPKLLDILLAHAGVFCHFSMRDLFVEYYSNVRKHSLQSFWTDCLVDRPQILELSYDDYFQSPDDKLADMGLSRPPLRLPNREHFEDGLGAGQEECRTDFGDLDFLALGRGLGTHDYIGQRVLQVGSIMRNLSFFEENLQLMANNRTFLRFLVMCSNIRWSNLHHMALDVMGNIANHLELGDPTLDDLTRCMLSTLCESLEGQDRGIIISSLEIICKIAQKDINVQHLLNCLDQKVYNQLCLFLTLNDIMLLLYTLECMYALTSLGQRSCNALIQVRGIVDTLVSLITVEAQSYGPDGCILMRVVETVPGNMLPMVAQNLANLQHVQHGHLMGHHHTLHQQPIHIENPLPPIANPTTDNKPVLSPHIQGTTPIIQQIPTTSPRPPTVLTPQATPPPPPSPVVNTIKEPAAPPTPPITGPKNAQQQLQENEQFALAWLRATFEPATTMASRIEQQELYKMYLTASQKSGRRGVVSPTHFPRCVRTVFGLSSGPNLLRITDANGAESSNYYYVSIRIKANPLPVHYKGVTIPPYQPTNAQQMQITTSPQIQKTVTKIQTSQLPVQQPQPIQTQTLQQAMPQTPQTPQHSVEMVIKTTPDVSGKLKTTKKSQQQQKQQLTPAQVQQQIQLLQQQQQMQIQQQQPTIQTQIQHMSTQTLGNQITMQQSPQQVQMQFVSQQSIQTNPTQQQTTIGQQQIQIQQQQTQQHQIQIQQQQQSTVIASPTPNIGISTNASTLIKSLLANKVTTATSTVTETQNASAAPNNPSCLITQNVNLHQVAQRQHLQKQKELAQQQQHQSQTLQTTTINALVNNPIIQSTPVKVGQTTIKAITTNAVMPSAIIEKKQPSTGIEITETSSTTWDPLPPLAPLSGHPRHLTNVIQLATSNEDSNSTGNNSVSSSIISTTQANTTDDGEMSLISFEGLLIPKNIKSGSSSATEDEGNSKDSFNKSTHVFNANQMLVDLLDRKSVDPPLGTTSVKRKLDDDFGKEGEISAKKLAMDQEVTVTASKNAANLYAEMAASILEDEDLDEVQIVQPPPPPPPPPPTIVQKTQMEQQKQMITVPLQRQIIMNPNNPHQMILSQGGQGTQQIPTQATATIKTESGLQTVPVILQKQMGPGGQQIIQPMIQQAQLQTQYVLATNQQGQTYLVAQQQPQQQPQMNQALLMTQTNQQQGGTPTKTIIILQQQGGPPQAVAQQQIIGGPGSSQKVIMTTQQGQQMIVQVPRPVQHHQLIMNPTTSILTAAQPQNVVMTQSGAIIQQSKHIQLQSPQQHMQIQASIQQTSQQQQQQHQQQQALLAQLPQIPATIKLHTQPMVQTQNTQTQTSLKIGQQKMPAIITQQQPQTQHIQIQQQQQQQPPQPQVIIQQQTVGKPQVERKQIFVTGNGNIEVTEVSVQQNFTNTAPVTSPVVVQPTGSIQNLPMQQQNTVVQQNFTIQQNPVVQQNQDVQQNSTIQQNVPFQQMGVIHQQQTLRSTPPPPVHSPAPTSTPQQIVSTPSPAASPQIVASPGPPAGPQMLQNVARSSSAPSSPIPAVQQTTVTKQAKTMADIRSDEEIIDPNWLWVCDWRGCPRKKFKSLAEVYRHACLVHCPDSLDPAAEIYCQWGTGPGLCDNIPRKRFSLMTHLSDRHCTLESFKAAVQRRNVTGIQLNPHSQPVTIIKSVQPASNTVETGTASPTLSTSSSGSAQTAGSAAMHAIKRHSTDFVNPKELMDENEGPVTKSIRLTAALILRNLVTHTSLAKRNIRHYEPLLAGVALSNVESSRTISQILYEMNN